MQRHGQLDRRDEVGLQVLLKARRLEVVGVVVLKHGSVVNQQVQLARHTHHRVYQAPALGRVGQIRLNDEGRRGASGQAVVACARGCFVAAFVVNHHRVTAAGQRQADLTPQALGAAGHQTDAAHDTRPVAFGFVSI